jgi:hypothetical protein
VPECAEASGHATPRDTARAGHTGGPGGLPKDGGTRGAGGGSLHLGYTPLALNFHWEAPACHWGAVPGCTRTCGWVIGSALPGGVGKWVCSVFGGSGLGELLAEALSQTLRARSNWATPGLEISTLGRQRTSRCCWMAISTSVRLPHPLPLRGGCWPHSRGRKSLWEIAISAHVDDDHIHVCLGPLGHSAAPDPPRTRTRATHKQGAQPKGSPGTPTPNPHTPRTPHNATQWHTHKRRYPITHDITRQQQNNHHITPTSSLASSVYVVGWGEP